MSTTPTQEQLDAIFPPSRTEAFFDALFGGAEEGAYDIRLRFVKADNTSALLHFALLQRPGKCLACNLTYGLPQVFARHPVLDVKGVAAAVAELLGWEPASTRWELGHTEEHSREEHAIPLRLHR